MTMIYTRFYNVKELPFDKPQALRYFGCRAEGLSAEAERLFDECVETVFSACEGKVCFSEFPIRKAEDGLDLGFTKTNSSSLSRNLAGCEKVVAFAATVGVGVDRFIARYGELSADRAYACQAIGAERIEALCDAFCADIAKKYRAEGLFVRPRFSCGYGDFPLEKQRDFFRALDCERKIGLTLNDSLLMSPSKSVTAVVGAGRGACRPVGDKCAACGKSDCEYRKG